MHPWTASGGVMRGVSHTARRDLTHSVSRAPGCPTARGVSRALGLAASRTLLGNVSHAASHAPRTTSPARRLAHPRALYHAHHLERLRAESRVTSDSSPDGVLGTASRAVFRVPPEGISCVASCARLLTRPDGISGVHAVYPARHLARSHQASCRRCFARLRQTFRPQRHGAQP